MARCATRRKPGTPPLPADTMQRVLDLTLADPPGETTHWSLWAVAKSAGIGVIRVRRIQAANQQRRFEEAPVVVGGQTAIRCLARHWRRHLRSSHIVNDEASMIHDAVNSTVAKLESQPVQVEPRHVPDLGGTGGDRRIGDAFEHAVLIHRLPGSRAPRRPKRAVACHHRASGDRRRGGMAARLRAKRNLYQPGWIIGRHSAPTLPPRPRPRP